MPDQGNDSRASTETELAAIVDALDRGFRRGAVAAGLLIAAARTHAPRRRICAGDIEVVDAGDCRGTYCGFPSVPASCVRSGTSHQLHGVNLVPVLVC